MVYNVEKLVEFVVEDKLIVDYKFVIFVKNISVFDVEKVF